MKPTKQSKQRMSICHEMQIHYKRPIYDSQKKITSSEDAEKLLKDFADTQRIDYKEFFWVVLLTNANQVIGISEIGAGTTTGVFVNFKEIFQLALLSNASGILIAHNHPSGTTEVSKSDKAVTKKIKTSCLLFDITLLDHLIITSEGFFSFSDNDLL